MAERDTLSKNSSQVFSLNSVFVEELYNQYLQDPNSVDQSWKEFFATLGEKKEFVISPVTSPVIIPSWGAPYENRIINVSRETNEKKLTTKDAATDGSRDITKEVTKEIIAAGLAIKIANLVQACRDRGHYLAEIDPLGLERITQKKDVRLDMDSFGISEAEQSLSVKLLSEVCGTSSASARQIISLLQNVYCNKIGYEFTYSHNFEENEWLQTEIENIAMLSDNAKKNVLDSLIKIESFEQFLHTRFPGAKRFSVEGAENAITAANIIVETLAEEGVEDVVFGMPHRGRLGMITNVLHKSYKVLLAEFLGKFPHTEGISGDVKYHLGAECDIKLQNGKNIHLSLASNPSHLEAINPVVIGKVRAEQDHIKDKERKKVAGVLFHGDASFAGQGVVMESLMMSELSGYNVGGVIHIVVNNQVGFTAIAREARLARYSTEIAKMIKAPIFHVNGDCAEEVVKVSKIAARYRNKFKKDVVIELVCYRLHGHNEIDEPRFTQPDIYKKISAKDTPAKIYNDKLVAEKLVLDSYFDTHKAECKLLLDKELEAAHHYKPEQEEWLKGLWKGYVHYTKAGTKDGGRSEKTGVKTQKLAEIGNSITTMPAKFNAHKIIIKGYEKRAESIKNGENIDWVVAESLAFGSLLVEGTNIRLSGQDSQRGTFSHRHSVITDQETGEKYTPLNNIAKEQGNKEQEWNKEQGSKEQGNFEVINSFLSEYAVMGFEYGYSIADPRNLVLWEAQFGDFSNGAQIIIDQFIAAAETKWMRSSGLVLLLPHGYEGQGPEHSSARLERYLQLCAENNMQVVNCSTPANYFHALRRQIHSNYRKPLIIMTPKSLLRNPAAVSSLKEFDVGTEFLPVLSDNKADHKEVKKLILCSGKLYYDLVGAIEKGKIRTIALIRVEQYYPFPEEELEREIKKYEHVAKVIWCQEEPENMGAWNFIRPKIEKLMKMLNIKKELEYVGRKVSASTAAGHASDHEKEQQDIIWEAVN